MLDCIQFDLATATNAARAVINNALEETGMNSRPLVSLEMLKEAAEELGISIIAVENGGVHLNFPDGPAVNLRGDISLCAGWKLSGRMVTGHWTSIVSGTELLATPLAALVASKLGLPATGSAELSDEIGFIPVWLWLSAEGNHHRTSYFEEEIELASKLVTRSEAEMRWKEHKNIPTPFKLCVES